MSDLTNPYSELNKPEVRERYYEGIRNKLIRTYYYLEHGLNLLNEFKYLIAGILAFYYFLKTDNIMIMVWIFVVAVPLLTVAGWFWLHKAKRSLEYFDLKYTHTNIFCLLERIGQWRAGISLFSC